ncbi:leucine-rich repeat-containing protein 51-like [Anableps anableps]
MYNPPVDLSFKDLNNVTGAMSEVPRTALRPLKTNSKNKYLSHSFRLSNNNITNLVGLEFMLSNFLAQPSMLGWLDLSFNKITSIDNVLCELKELRVLYLHGNDIWNLNEVNKLGELNYLHTITLHGNGIESIKGYRAHVILALPHLKRMDFSAVTCQERVLANIWCKSLKKVKKEKHDHSKDE